MPEALDHKKGGCSNKVIKVQGCGKTRRKDVCGYKYWGGDSQIKSKRVASYLEVQNNAKQKPKFNNLFTTME